MKNTNKSSYSDVQECRDKILNLLREYNCYLMSADEWSEVLIVDNDTNECKGFRGK